MIYIYISIIYLVIRRPISPAIHRFTNPRPRLTVPRWPKTTPPLHKRLVGEKTLFIIEATVGSCPGQYVIGFMRVCEKGEWANTKETINKA